MPEIGSKFTVIQMHPTVNGDTYLIHEIFRKTGHGFHNTISIKQLQEALENFEHVYAFEFWLNGELLCDVEITRD